MLRRFLVTVLCVLQFSSLPAIAARQKAPAVKEQPITSPELVLRFIDRYRASPDPQRVPDLVKTMSALGLFKDMEGAGVHVGFIGGVLGTNPKNAEVLVSRMFPLPPEDQVAIVRAIAYSGLPDWKELLGKFIERMPARAVLIDRYMSGKLPVLQAAPLEKGPSILDANWGYYFATGAWEPVDRIMTTLAWSKEPDDIEKLTLAGMTKWTLANNASRDTDLLKHMKDQAAVIRDKVAVEALKDIIEAVETSDTARIRKDAVASIEELRAKGPLKNRNMSWWAQAGSTLIAAGCITAAALGQVYLGVPCIIGGPLSTAAAKYLIPSK